MKISKIGNDERGVNKRDRGLNEEGMIHKVGRMESLDQPHLGDCVNAERILKIFPMSKFKTENGLFAFNRLILMSI
jgi:hypothetical protein